MKIKIEWDGPKIAENTKQVINQEICKKTPDKTYKTKVIDEFEKYLVMLDDDYKKTRDIFKEVLPPSRGFFTLKYGELYFAFELTCKAFVWYLKSVDLLPSYFSQKPNFGKKTIKLELELEHIRQKAKKILGERVKLIY